MVQTAVNWYTRSASLLHTAARSPLASTGAGFSAAGIYRMHEYGAGSPGAGD